MGMFRKEEIMSEEEKKFLEITDESTDSYAQEMVAPIICEGDVIGAVVLLEIEDKDKMGEVEKKLAQSAAAFLGRQMEQ